ncbi:hypothetical protein IQ07DRAFT_643428 [Pyrenochaeta sp. DS3sAY3a]|nr:hypothetical protein IQ07DRAFT_643428 [Pyrenochaeta sp. DS3sAY3a]
MRPLNPEAPVPDFINDLSGRETRDGGALQSVAIVTNEEIAAPSGPRRPRRAQGTGSRESRRREWQQRREEQRQEQLRQEGERQRQLSPIGPHQRQHTPRPEERLPRSQYFEDFLQESAFGETQSGVVERGGAGDQNWFGGLGPFVWYDGNGYVYGPGYGYESL